MTPITSSIFVPFDLSVRSPGAAAYAASSDGSWAICGHCPTKSSAARHVLLRVSDYLG